MRQGPEEHREVGQIAYDTWRAALGNYDHGIWLPPWEELMREDIRDLWRAIAREVMRKGWFESQRPPGFWKKKK